MSYMEIPVGPQHPALKEPIRFVFKVDGEIIVDVEPRLGYAHRGIEKLAETRTYVQNIYLFERICGICSAAHTLCYVGGVEELIGVEVPYRAKYLRTIVAELNRIHSHLLWYGVLAHEIGFDTLFMYAWRDREYVLDIVEMLCGNRVLYGYNLIGGVRHDITPQIEEAMRKMIKYMKQRIKYYRKVTQEDNLIRARTQDVGMLKRRDAIELGAVGPTARASNVDMDVRRDDPYAAYGEIPFNVITYKDEDSYARTLVRIDEIEESLNIIEYALSHLPSDGILVDTRRYLVKVPIKEVVSRAEAPRGELIYYIRSNGTNKPDRIKIRTPTLANIPAVCVMLKGSYIADIPVIVASIDPCIACTDRVTLVDIRKGKVIEMSHLELIKHANEWYRRCSK